MKHVWFAMCFALGVVLGTMLVQAEEIGSVDTAWNLFSNHKVVIEAIDDPKVDGVSCFLSRPKTGGALGAVGLASDKSNTSIACRQIGPIDAVEVEGLEPGEQVFTEATSIFFKEIRVVRFYDPKRKTIAYLSYSTKLIDGSPKSAISTVVVRPWE